MQRLYEPQAYSAGSLAGCYWPDTVTQAPEPRGEGEITADVAVVGAGFTGLSAALHLAEAGADVVALDAQRLGWGASGRNGGFCCLGGSMAAEKTLIRRHGAADVALWHKAQRASVELVAELLERHGISADTHSRGETMLAHRPRDMAALQAEADHLKRAHGLHAAVIGKAALAENGMNSDAFHGALTAPVGFALNPLKYLLGLAKAARGAGARLFGDSPVNAIKPSDSGEGFTLSTPKARVYARRLILATNGYSSDDIPNWMAGRYMPVQSNIIVTRPLSGAEIAAQGWSSGQMAYDSRELLHYFRLMPDRRFLFGMRGGLKATQAQSAHMQRQIRADFSRMFPAWANVDITHFWSGLVCILRALTPFTGSLGNWNGAYAGFGWHGNGVAMGSYSGALLADLALGRAPRRPYPDLMKTPPRRFPLGRNRRILMAPVYRWLELKDRE